jgi:hypothetical protein
LIVFLALGAALAVLLSSRQAAAQPECARTIEADIVAIDQPIFLNRLGASMPGGMIYALRRDIVAGSNGPTIEAGNAQLNPNHRPRPLVLRARVGDCLHIKFQNLLSPVALPASPGPCNPNAIYPEQTCTREAGVHVVGMEEQAIKGTLMDGSFVGANPSSLVAPSGSIDYMFRAPAEGVFLMYSTAANAITTNSGGGPGGQLSAGLFGSLVVEPRTAEWYRSQVTKADLDAATTRQSADGHPIIDYGALRVEGASCVPILRMVDVRYRVDGGKCVAAGTDLITYHGDLTALVTGPNAGPFPPNDKLPPFNPVAVEPNRHEPYREFVEHYHDVLTVSAADQAFPSLYGADSSSYVLTNGGEAFAINYGTGGIGSEILANRLGVGPEGGCVECRFEEFFLSSWAVGDPASLVGHPDGLKPSYPPQQVPYQPKTTLTTADEVKYPDDPSNVYHSYVGDRVIFRVVHAGQLVTHVHHLHAHQWLHTPNSDTSTYLDSQLISPGSTFTQEIDYDGSGNRNRTPGDAIFHCHFYPHFAAGMWGLWRNHDVFEPGTDTSPSPATLWNRALPDGEFAQGTPIPAVVPLPTLPMAPLPARVRLCPVDRNWNGSQVLDGSGACPAIDQTKLSGEAAYVAKADFEAGRDPGFPFYIPGVGGQRVPHPPLGYPRDPVAQPPGQTAYLDGGLARHITLAGEVSNDHYNAWDFSKDLDSVTATPLPETGTPLERLAMATHSQCQRPSFTPEGAPGNYILNGGPSVPGAPYANPSWGSKGSTACLDLADPAPPPGNPRAPSRVYKAADVQMDAVLSKTGWHYPQLRFETLWQDVQPTLAGQRAPEPLFFRANSGETIEFWQTNLIPAYYELDDFQVRTPTDVIGQHIHLVKFDVTSSDGAANGFNYESGSLGPDAVREEIGNIRKANNCQAGAPVSFACPVAKPAPAEFGTPPAGQDWTGAQTTVERWWADPVVDNQGVDRTLRTVFTHDHFSPSTHQQAGLYSGLVVEPRGSSWTIPALPNPGGGAVQTAVPMGRRPDGGPTSWTADVRTQDPTQSYREFALEFQDLQLAYTDASVHHAKPYPCGPVRTPGADYSCDSNAAPTATTPTWGWASQAAALNRPTRGVPPAPVPAPQAIPQLISVGIGVASTNYRTEPLPLRVAAASGAHDPARPAQDLALAYASIPRETAALNTQPASTQKLWPADPTSDVRYPGGFLGAAGTDPYTPLLRAYAGDRVQVRVLVGAHELNHSFALHGVDWLFEPSEVNSGHNAAQPMGISEHFELLFRLPPGSGGKQSDYLYQTDANFSGQEDGMWGLLRAYNAPQPDLPLLPSNPRPPAQAAACPADARHVPFNVSAVTAAAALPYDPANTPTDDVNTEVLRRGSLRYNSRTGGPITQPDAILYVRSENLDASHRLKPGVPVEPLILRASAGDCIDVTLTNWLNPAEVDINGKPVFANPDPDQYPPSGMKPIRIYPSARAGLHAQLLQANVLTSDGMSVGQNPDQTAGPNGGVVRYTWYAGLRDGERFVPAELGAVNLQPADPIEQPQFGAVGALVIEPPGSRWQTDFGTAAAATVFAPGRPPFREFVGIWQAAIDCAFYPPKPNCAAPSGTDPHTPLGEGLNYRAEPVPFRVGTQSDISNAYSNTVLAPSGSTPDKANVLEWDPQTPIFAASSTMPARFRFVNAGGNITLPEIFGAHWQEEPWQGASTRIGPNPLSQSMGAVILDSSHALNLVVDHAGAPGDYLFRNFIASPRDYAMWGLFRVGPPAPDVLVLTTYKRTSPTAAAISGYVTPDLKTGKYASDVQLIGLPVRIPVDPATGAFRATVPNPPPSLIVRSGNGAVASASLAPPPPTALQAAAPQPAVVVPKVLDYAAAPGSTGSTHFEQIESKAAKFRARRLNIPVAPQ